MSNLFGAAVRGRRSMVKIGPWLACSFGALLWGGCGETEKNSHADPPGHGGSGGSGGNGSETASTVSAGMSASSGGSDTVGSTTVSSVSAATTTGQGAAGTGGALATSTTDQGAAGAGGSVEPDDDCEVETFDITNEVCQVETRCVEFVQHTNCRLNNDEMWQCDTDEHDNSKPSTAIGNPGWYNVVTGTSDAAAACDAVVAVNLHRSSVTADDLEDCSEFSIASESSAAHFELCGKRYHASSGATVWKEQPASAGCTANATGQTCDCLNTGADDGKYELDASDLESALADVWEFCTNSSSRVPVEQRECDLVSEDTASDGSCNDIKNCLLGVTDDSGLELEQELYQEISCGRDSADAALTCTCRLGNETLSFLPSQEPGVSACEDLASVCDGWSSVERADAPAECERNPEIIGHDTLMQSYVCSIPIVLGDKSGLAQGYAGLVCELEPDGVLTCSCSDAFTRTTFPLEPNTADVETAWELAAAQCEALLEASPGDL